jgi:hypothetical protein
MKHFKPCLAAAVALLSAPLTGAQTMQAAPSMPSAPAAPAAPVGSGYQTVLPGAPVARALPASQWTSVQIRQSFELADSNSNGELTRAEAQQLSIMPHSFEDMDENKDGVITRAEYENAFSR